VATSFVEFKGYGFWAHDIDLLIWLRFILGELKEWPSKGVWLQVGCIHLGLDKFLISADRESEIRTLAEKTLQKLTNRTGALSLAELNAMDFDGIKFSQDLPIQLVATIGTLFIRLLAGELKTTASSKIDYWYRA